ncbi:MAG: carboxypeptidase regulatory-like domain-containing protein [Planctomycetia bacterium]|nr:carboxypeptidase regulatory-like domain-containing protein [Planctomycetia bacterium]
MAVAAVVAIARSCGAPSPEGPQAEPPLDAAPRTREVAPPPARRRARVQDEPPSPVQEKPRSAEHASDEEHGEQGDRVAETVRFLVRAENDEAPLGGAQIEVRPRDEEKFVLTTDAAGRAATPRAVRLEGLEVTTAASGFARQHRRPEPGPGEEVVIELEPGRHVSGRVLDARTSEPLAGARVEAYGRGQDVDIALPIVESTTDSQGCFAFDGAQDDDEAVVVAHAPGHVSRSATYEDGKAILLLLEPGGTVRGVVRGPDGAPVSGAGVSVASFSKARLYAAPSPRAASTNADGRYVVDGLPLGTPFRLLCEAEGFAQFEGVTPVETTAVVRDVVRDVALSRGATLLVRVVDPNGAPLSHANVDLCHGAEYRGRLNAGSDGARFEHLEAGSWRIAIWTGMYAASVHDFELVDGETKDMQIRAEPGGMISGVVVDVRGEPLARANISLKEDSGCGGATSTTVSTNLDGTFQLRGLAARPYELTVSAKGHKKTTLTLTPGPSPQRIELP